MKYPPWKSFQVSRIKTISFLQAVLVQSNVRSPFDEQIQNSSYAFLF